MTHLTLGGSRILRLACAVGKNVLGVMETSNPAGGLKVSPAIGGELIRSSTCPSNQPPIIESLTYFTNAVHNTPANECGDKEPPEVLAIVYMLNDDGQPAKEYDSSFQSLESRRH
ncbi:hypothetical protein DAPPUDRAFT_239238 [Daphnia pulex]|uniref:Uncharacterized protein n=1 Tax=Daphnia pulex TaxID=6669 RepID=E9G8Q4_DAPPU|nr:hypothetical protein DAPPUDRAFT_239238 [Daphnia pulex]|eukprot:EFX84012.1 hypothetical protein DAPPUDRAFT_239238 [Daphnia pulex]